MTSSYRAVTLVFACALLAAALASDAHAYIDPGTGSYLLQLLIAGVLGGLFALKLYWTNVMAFIRRLFHKPKDDEE